MIRANGLLKGGAGVPLLMLGGLNDVPDAQTSLVLNGPPGSEIGTPGFDRPDGGDDARLFNLAPLIPQERRYSRVARGRPEMLDQILASVGCFPGGRAASGGFPRRAATSTSESGSPPSGTTRASERGTRRPTTRQLRRASTFKSAPLA